MRVIAGTARSLPLKAPPGTDTRPTTDRVKETLFNILQPRLGGAVFVDLFSGSGAIGIEALSRGARKAYFVENRAGAVACIRQNLAFTRLEQSAVVIRQDAAAALADLAQEADVVFLDPPYGSGEERRALEAAARCACVTPKTLLVVESDLATDFSYLEELGFFLEREKRYKTNRHLFLGRGEKSGFKP